MIGADDFRSFIASRLGCEPPSRIEPGRFVRFSANGKHGDDAGYAKLFPDLEGGIVGNFRSGESWTWQAKRERPFTDAERRAWQERYERERRKAEVLRLREEKEAAQRAKAIGDKAQPAPSDHPYLAEKRIQAHGAKLYRGPLAIGGMRCDGALIVPVRSAAGKIQTLEFIAPNSEKRFLPGGRKGGGYFSIGAPNGTICIAEGFATGASVHEATGHAVAVAFDAGNLELVAKALRAKFSAAKLILCADNDVREDASANTGIEAATKAAQAVGGLLAIPELGGRKCDWNDVHSEHGAGAVRRAIMSAVAPVAPEAQPSVGNAPAATVSAGSDLVRVELVSGADVRPQPIDWLWDGWLAAGKLHIVAGAPEAGKTSIALALAATLTAGGRWPDGVQAKAGNVVLWSGEDAIRDTLTPRLIALGADMTRVRFVGRVSDADYMRPFDPAEDMTVLQDALDGGETKLLILDPIVSAVAGDSHENAKVRRSLQPVVDLAETIGCAVLGVSHFSKGTAGRDPIERVTGSVAFGALPRLVFAAAKLPEDEGGGRIFVRSKSNIGPSGGGFGYALHACEVAAGITTSRLLWGDALAGNARALLAQVEVADGGEHSELADAADWLRDRLAEGVAEAREILREAELHGFHRRAIQRAKDRIGAKSKREGFGKGSRMLWTLGGPIGDIDDGAKRKSPMSPMAESVTYEGGPGQGGEPESEVI